MPETMISRLQEFQGLCGLQRGLSRHVYNRDPLSRREPSRVGPRVAGKIWRAALTDCLPIEVLSQFFTLHRKLCGAGECVEESRALSCRRHFCAHSGAHYCRYFGPREARPCDSRRRPAAPEHQGGSAPVDIQALSIELTHVGDRDRPGIPLYPEDVTGVLA
jgi:hypothetical protein